MWFLDLAKKTGFNFDYISFHYYHKFSERGYWFDKYFGQMRAMAAKYKTKIFYNELNCAEIYSGNTDGGYPGDRGCYDAVDYLMEQVTTKYNDIIAEINVYEMLNEPYHSVVHERNFGLMYDLNRPKRLFDLYTEYAEGQGSPAPAPAPGPAPMPTPNPPSYINVNITSPVKDQVITSSNQGSLSVSGSCQTPAPVVILATDAKGKSNSSVSATCQANFSYRPDQCIFIE